MKNYELFLKETHIGSLTETNRDMRSSGAINYHFNYLHPSSRLAAFIRLSIRYSECLENGTKEELNEICKTEEEQFMDFVDSEDWHLKTANEKIPIPAPIFHEGNEITWQIDMEALRKSKS